MPAAPLSTGRRTCCGGASCSGSSRRAPAPARASCTGAAPAWPAWRSTAGCRSSPPASSAPTGSSRPTPSFPRLVPALLDRLRAADRRHPLRRSGARPRVARLLTDEVMFELGELTGQGLRQRVRREASKTVGIRRVRTPGGTEPGAEATEPSGSRSRPPGRGRPDRSSKRLQRSGLTRPEQLRQTGRLSPRGPEGRRGPEGSGRVQRNRPRAPPVARRGAWPSGPTLAGRAQDAPRLAPATGACGEDTAGASLS